MNLRYFWTERHQFRAVLCGHKAVEVGAVCLVLMVQGNLGEVTLAHFLIATKTGLWAVSPALGITFTRHARHFVNRWTSSAFLGFCTFVADALSHASHYPGAYMEAALTGIGAFAFSIVISFTPIGKRIDRLAEGFLHHERAAIETVQPAPVTFVTMDDASRVSASPSASKPPSASTDHPPPAGVFSRDAEPVDVALFLPFGRNNERQSPASGDTMRRSKIDGFYEE